MLNETPLSTEQRNNLDDKQFGIPEIRAYPLNDKDHVIQAVRMFNHVDSKYEKELADNLIKAITKFKIDVTVGKDNRFHKYYIGESHIMNNRVKNVGSILEGLHRDKMVNESARGRRAAKDIQKFIDGYGFRKFDVYDRDDYTLAIDVEGERESEVIALLNRLHAWGLNADLWEHYIEIDIEGDDRW